MRDGRALNGDSESSKKRKEGHLGLREFWKVRMDMSERILRLVSRPVVCSGGLARYAGKLEGSRGGYLKCKNQKHVFIFLSSKNFEHESNVIITGLYNITWSQV